ncbi:carbohydrate ABC transporter permease [Pseudarthrobacter oxydans]|uniref:carbohydrate ABC transporter permease n=1 Tax=Pseudarthrobacter oxydans TaxID=1671 RepID=UPI0034123F24
MALPACIGLVVFLIGPMLVSGLLSTTNWSIGLSPQFVGMQNYQRLFSEDPLFWKSLGVTGYYTLLVVPLTLAVAFMLAVMLNQKVRGLATFRTIYYLPTLVPMVASALLWNWMFNPQFGLFNEFLRSMGISTGKWIMDEATVIPSLALMGVWGFGNVMVIFLAGLQGVPVHLYEAIEIDGGGAWHKFWNITLPSMSPIIFFNLVTGLVAAIQSFHQAYLMTGGGPNNGSSFIVYYLYKTAFTKGEMGYASALAWIVFLICAIATLAMFRWAKQWVHYAMEN